MPSAPNCSNVCRVEVLMFSPWGRIVPSKSVIARYITDYLWNYNINFTIQQEIPDNHYFYYTDIYPRHTDYQRRVEKFQEFGTVIQQTSEIKTAATQVILILEPNPRPHVSNVLRMNSVKPLLRSEATDL